MKRLAILPVLLPCALLAATYEVSFDHASATATVILAVDSGTAREFQMPAWSPGDYKIVDHGKNVRSVRFTRLGLHVPHEKISTNLWRALDDADAVTYTVGVHAAGIFTENFRLSPDEVFVHGPAVFGWLGGKAEEPHTLRLTPYPGDGATVAIALPRIDPYTLRAKNYDVLVDSPFAMGRTVRIVDFVVGGKKHEVAAFGPRSAGVALDSFVDIGQQVVTQGLDLFGELPYDKYVFLYDFGGAGGGLEHADSARMAMWTTDARQAAGFIAHEDVHAFNVKRIRTKPLGPFDYSKPAVTGALWWFEGVTDYVAEVLLVRAGIQTRERALRGFSSDLRSFSRVANRLRVSADESSRRVWETRASSGYGIDYYAKGKLIGLVLDLAIRGETSGTKSLDDVLRALYAETKGNKPGFAEGRIRELCVEIGGAALGPVYDACVLQAVELPIERALAKVGMKLSDGSLQDDPVNQQLAGAAWPNATKK